MRNRTNWITFVFVVALTVFSVIVVWPNMPERYLPNFVPWPEGHGLNIAGLERRAMRLGLDLKGGTYVLLEADTSRLPAGTDIGNALDGVKDVLERRVNAFGVSETEITREGPNRLAVQMPGIDPDEARDLLGKTAQLKFLKPVLDESGKIVCENPDGSTYAVGFQAGALPTHRTMNDAGCPALEQGPIAGGQSAITGLDLGEARRLAIQLNAGALPVPMRAIQETEVDATLGEREVIRTEQAGLIGIL